MGEMVVLELPVGSLCLETVALNVSRDCGLKLICVGGAATDGGHGQLLKEHFGSAKRNSEPFVMWTFAQHSALHNRKTFFGDGDRCRLCLLLGEDLIVGLLDTDFSRMGARGRGALWGSPNS